MPSLRRPLLPAILVVAILSGCGVAAPTSSGPRPSGITVDVGTDAGADLRFVPDVVRAPANSVVRITFRNGSSQSHNLTLRPPLSGGTRTIVEAGGSDVAEVMTTSSGRFMFACTIHIDMTGTLLVE